MSFEPPSKRAHFEQRSGGDDSSANSARERFLRELARYASSSSDDEGDAQQHIAQAGPSLSFFDEAAQREAALRQAAAARQAHRGPDATRRVGSGLLANMHAQGEPSEAVSGTRAMRIVETYTPLSSGGFMDASAEHGNVQGIKVGDVVCRRQAQNNNSLCNTAAKATPGSTTSTTAKATTSAEDTETYGSPTFTSPSLNSAEAVQAALHADSNSSKTTNSTSDLLSHFRKASELSRDEQLYGRHITSDMLSAIGLVTRLDRASQSLEVCFADGTRAKLSLYAVRPAGFVERALYQRWQADPQSRPVPVIVHDTTTTTTKEEGKEKAASGEDVGVTSQASEGQTSHATTSSAASSVTWWVIPHLLVRVVAPEAGPEWRQRVGVVMAVKRKENKIRLMALPASSEDSKTSTTAMVEVVGQAGLAPVVPRPGQRGLVVLGDSRGEQVEVLRRVEDAEGSVTHVHVRAIRTGTTLDLPASAVCMVYERK